MKYLQGFSENGVSLISSIETIAEELQPLISSESKVVTCFWGNDEHPEMLFRPYCKDASIDNYFNFIHGIYKDGWLYGWAQFNKIPEVNKRGVEGTFRIGIPDIIKPLTKWGGMRAAFTGNAVFTLKKREHISFGYTRLLWDQQMSRDVIYFYFQDYDAEQFGGGTPYKAMQISRSNGIPTKNCHYWQADDDGSKGAELTFSIPIV